VLDLACGIGYGAKILLDNPAVTNYVGVDVAEDAIAEAQRTAPAHARFITGSALDLPFDDAAFDAIVLVETLEHLEDSARAVAEVRRVLKPHDVLVGLVPTADHEVVAEASGRGHDSSSTTIFDYRCLKGTI
jgi:2-polyprenyl-6-hydroxyphenyl methylase/3-demethylubiquinone-9 3-methyltransferase